MRPALQILRRRRQPPRPYGTIRRAIVAALKADAGVAGVFGARVYPLVVPESSALPAMSVRLLSDVPDKTLGGHSGSSVATFRLTCVTKHLTDGETGAEAVRAAVDAFAGNWTSPGAQDVQVFRADLVDEADEVFDAADGTGAPYLTTRADYRIRYRKSRSPNTTL